MTQRSGCPINLSLEIFGDRWSLLILRDVMFGNRRYFNELLRGSNEGIASNILAARLSRLVSLGMLTKEPDHDHRQRQRYSLTEPAIQLVPVFAQLGAWGRRHLPVSHALAVRAELLEQGGPELWAQFQDELRVLHLGAAPHPGDRSVLAELTAAHREAVAG